MNTFANADEIGIGPDGRLAIGCFSSICRNRLGDQMVAFARQCPDVELGVHEMARASLLPALSKGDLALAIMPETEHDGLQAMELWQDRVMLAVHRNHPLTQQDAIRPEDLLDEVFLVSRQQLGGDMHRFLQRCVMPRELTLNSMLIDLSQSVLMGEVAAGRGVSLVCESHRELAGPAVTLRPIDAAGAQFSVHAYWNADRPEAALAALIGVLQSEKILRLP